MIAINEKLLGKVATDYIIERGENANGYYEKWRSGMLKQWGKSLMSDELKTKHGDTNFYRHSAEKIQNFPISFVGDAPTIVATARAALNIVYVSTNELTHFGYYALASTSTNANSRYIHWEATGKWK